MLQWLHVLDVHHEDISWLGLNNVERSREIVNPGEVDISHVIGRVIIADLSPSPVYTFDLDCLAVLNISNRWN